MWGFGLGRGGGGQRIVNRERDSGMGGIVVWV